MKHIFAGFNLIGAIALLSLAIGCTGMQTQSKENLLIAAGFRTIAANTPQRQKHLKTLPPDRVTVAQRHGKTYYAYVDPADNQIYLHPPASVSILWSDENNGTE